MLRWRLLFYFERLRQDNDVNIVEYSWNCALNMTNNCSYEEMTCILLKSSLSNYYENLTISEMRVVLKVINSRLVPKYYLELDL